MPRIISTRDQLLAFIANKIVYPYIRRAIGGDGSVENYGAFSMATETGKAEDGWVVKITTATGREVVIFVMPTDRGYRLHCANAAPPLRYWVGDKSENKLYRGDCPEKYTELREKEINNAKA